MSKAWLVAMLLAGCVTDGGPDVASTEQDVHGDTDGWGQWCDDPPVSGTDHLYNVCHNRVNDEDGVCSFSICRRWCSDPVNRTGCPRHFHAVPIVGDACYCEPDMKSWESDRMVPAAHW